MGQVPGRLSVDGALTVELATSRDGVNVVLSGELDLSTADGLRRRLLDVLGTATCATVDAAGLGFVDLAGLDVLLDLDTRLRAEGGALVVRRASPPLRRLLALLDDPLPVEG